MIRGNKAGFSLMEVMIAVAIIAIMAALLGPNLIKFLGRAKSSSTKSNIAALKNGLLDYNADIGHFPDKTEGGLLALIKRPKGDKFKTKWAGPYIDTESIPEDGWGQEFIYNRPPVKFKQFKQYELYSAGPNNDPDEVNDLYAGA